MRTKPPEERFWPKVKKTKTCWLWTASKAYFGYGCFYDGKRQCRSHRFSYELHNRQQIPKGLFVCHKCDNPSCVNPKHLFLGTQKDNVNDMIAKGRTNYKHLRGKDHPLYGKHVPQEQKDRSASKQAKTYRITTPNGKRIKFKNLRRFCRINGLYRSNMCDLRHHPWRHVKGYTNLTYA